MGSKPPRRYGYRVTSQIVRYMMLCSQSKVTRKARFILGLLALYGTVGTIPAHAQSNRDIVNRLSRLENEIETMGRAVYKGENPPAGSVSMGGDAAGNAETVVRLQQLETQISDMNGKLEEKDHQINQLQEQLQRLTEDMQMRLGDLEKGGASGAGSFTSGSSSTGQYNANPINNGTVDQEGGMHYQQRIPDNASSSGDGYQWSSGSSSEGAAPSGSTEKQLGTISEGGSKPSSDAAAAAYENAFSLLKSARYDEAEAEFKTFLSAYPDHTLSGNAKYWLGESYYVRGKFSDAARVFAEAYQQNPKGPKAADNLLKMGMSLAGMDKKQDACVALGQINKEFANSGPVLRRADQEMKRLGC